MSNYKKMWKTLDKKLDKLIDYYRNCKGMELAESMDGEKICLRIKNKMKKLEEKYNDDE